MLNHSLDSVLEIYPLAAQVLSRHGVEFCCAGNVALGDAIARANANPSIIVKEIEALGRAQNDAPEDLTTPELIRYILVRFHEKHRQELPQLIMWAEKVERVHSENSQCPKGLSRLLRETLDEMEAHMEKEEQILFPMLSSGQNMMAMMPMHVMRHEHVEHEAKLRAIEACANECVLPANACRTWTNLYTGLDHFISELRAHIVMENDILFKRNGG